jgi:hypothetical protein
MRAALFSTRRAWARRPTCIEERRLRINCPYCGLRDVAEFTYLGAADLKRLVGAARATALLNTPICAMTGGAAAELCTRRLPLMLRSRADNRPMRFRSGAAASANGRVRWLSKGFVWQGGSSIGTTPVKLT